MQIFNTLKQSKYLKHSVITGTLLFLVVIFSVIPQKEYFVCQNKWNSIPSQITVIVKSYAFGLKHTLNHFSLSECETFTDSIVCRDSNSSSTFDRITADYDEILKIRISFYRCEKTQLKI
jgi:hypothetical protein